MSMPWSSFNHQTKHHKNPWQPNNILNSAQCYSMNVRNEELNKSYTNIWFVFGLGANQTFNHATFYQSDCTKPGQWTVMYLCVRDAQFYDFYIWFLELFPQYGIACTKSGSLRFSQFSRCWLILSVYILMSFDFPFVRLFGVR
jgi:hypothetical protein